MNTAAKVRGEKEDHPERFCANPTCLWRTSTKAGLSPCPRHPVAIVVPPIDLDRFVAATLDGAIGDRPIETEADALAAVEFGLMARVQRPLNAKASHAPLLHKWRGVPEKYQRIALEQMKKDYRWTNRREGGGDERIYVSVFNTLIDTFFYKFAKPIADVPGYEGPTQKLTTRSGYPPRVLVHAMDPSKWGPIFRKRAAAKRANAPKQSSRSSDTDWRAEQERAAARAEKEAKEWRDKWPGIIDRLTTAINAGAIDEALSQMLLDEFHDSHRSKEYKSAVARIPLGETGLELVRHLAFRSIIGRIEHPYQGSREWPKLEKRLGLGAQSNLAADKPKGGKKKRAAEVEIAASAVVADALETLELVEA
jgi:hypothetical protein